MKKFLSFLVLAIAFTSCSEDITRNNPSFQGLKDDVLWRAAGITATKTDNGLITITGSRQFETLILKTNSPSEITYGLGTSDNRRRAFFIIERDGETTTYSTLSGVGDGQIVISEYDDVANTISGTFRFNAVNEADATETDVLNFQSGVFYKIPVTPAE